MCAETRLYSRKSGVYDVYRTFQTKPSKNNVARILLFTDVHTSVCGRQWLSIHSTNGRYGPLEPPPVNTHSHVTRSIYPYETHVAHSAVKFTGRTRFDEIPPGIAIFFGFQKKISVFSCSIIAFMFSAPSGPLGKPLDFPGPSDLGGS